MSQENSKDVSATFNDLEAWLKQRYYGWDGRNQFTGTGERLVRAYQEFCWPNEKIDSELERHLSTAFVDKYDEMLVAGPVRVWTLCPHHLLPCKFTVHVGYIPDDLVLGLSKLARVAETLAHRPVIQEMYTREVAKVIQNKLNPKGVGVYVVGEHDCMRSRGIKQEACVSTSFLTGAMFHNPASRAEFLTLVTGGQKV